MKTIKILHASDLHISIHKQARSVLDKLSDADFRDWSRQGRQEKLKTFSGFLTAWRKKIAASSYDPEILEFLAEYIYQNAKRKLDEQGEEIFSSDANLDAVILTGDLATTGSEDDIGRTRKFLNSAYNPKYPHKAKEHDYRGATLSAVKIPVVILPGNHDRYVLTGEQTPMALGMSVPKIFNVGGENFDKHLLDYRKENAVRVFEIEENISSGKVLKVIILTADLTLKSFDDHEGFYGWLAQGKVTKKVLDRLTKETQTAFESKKDNETLCVLWACHFPPLFPGIKRHSNLFGEDKLIKRANDLGVRAILAGHTHHQLKYNSPSMKCEVLCCGTTTQFEPQTMPGGRDAENYEAGNFFQIITIEADVKEQIQLSVEHYKYSSSGTGSFLMGQSVQPIMMSWEKCPE